jgi:hypothetical protein
MAGDQRNELAEIAVPARGFPRALRTRPFVHVRGLTEEPGLDYDPGSAFRS